MSFSNISKYKCDHKRIATEKINVRCFRFLVFVTPVLDQRQGFLFLTRVDFLTPDSMTSSAGSAWSHYDSTHTPPKNVFGKFETSKSISGREMTGSHLRKGGVGCDWWPSGEGGGVGALILSRFYGSCLSQPKSVCDKESSCFLLFFYLCVGCSSLL